MKHRSTNTHVKGLEWDKSVLNSKIEVGFHILITSAWQFGWNVNYKNPKH